MTRFSIINRNWLLTGAAVVVIGGSAVIYLTRPATPPAAEAKGEQADEGDAEETSAAEGLVVLTDAQIVAAGIDIVSVSGGGGGETRLSGRVEPMIDARAAVAAMVGGRVERVFVATGQSVRAGQALAVLVSGDAASLRADADAAQANAVAAQQAHGREERLAEQGVVAWRDAELAHAQALSAEAAARAARARASAAGAPNALGRVNVTSPISGVVTNVQVGTGGFVAQGGVIAEVTNPSRVEIVFNAPPALAAQVRAGSSIRVQGPAGEFDAQVTGVAAGAGAESGATVIRAHPTGSLLPPAGSAVMGAVVTGEAVSGMTVPSEAVQTVENATVVFVRTTTGFRMTPVLAGRQANGRTEILRGLSATDRVAGANAFLLKAEMAKGEAEHGH